MSDLPLNAITFLNDGKGKSCSWQATWSRHVSHLYGVATADGIGYGATQAEAIKSLQIAVQKLQAELATLLPGGAS